MHVPSLRAASHPAHPSFRPLAIRMRQAADQFRVRPADALREMGEASIVDARSRSAFTLPGRGPCMLALAGARDWFDWSGWSFTVGGTLLSLAGLYLTFREARGAERRAREAGTAAHAARVAALDAVKAVATSTTAGDLMFIRKDLEAVLTALDAGRLPAALAAVRASREALNRLGERLESTVHRSEIRKVLDDIARLQQSLELTVHEGFEAPRFVEVSMQLSRHMDLLSRWSEQVRFQKAGAL
jgi:hypothetical protein